MRPILFDLDVAMRPARMTVCFPGRPNKFIVVRIKAPVETMEEARTAAIAEMDGWTPDQRALLEECAAAAPVAPDPPLVAVMVEKVEQEERYTGVLFCPACCRKLGRGDDPIIGYLKACPGCFRGLTITFTTDAVRILLSAG